MESSQDSLSDGVTGFPESLMLHVFISPTRSNSASKSSPYPIAAMAFFVCRRSTAKSGTNIALYVLVYVARTTVEKALSLSKHQQNDIDSFVNRNVTISKRN